jgi:hypothetical protein
MATMPQPYNDQQLAQMRRVKELEAGGFIECRDQRWLHREVAPRQHPRILVPVPCSISARSLTRQAA